MTILERVAELLCGPAKHHYRPPQWPDCAIYVAPGLTVTLFHAEDAASGEFEVDLPWGAGYLPAREDSSAGWRPSLHFYLDALSDLISRGPGVRDHGTEADGSIPG